VTPVELEGTVKQLSVKEPKQDKSGEPKPVQQVTTFCVEKVAPGILARLCKNPGEAQKAMSAASKAGGKVEIPCRGETMQVRWYKGARKKPSVVAEGVTLNKVIVDSRNEGESARVKFTEGLDKELAALVIDNLGRDFKLEIAKSQSEMFDGE
jgi:hypothetical protein